MFLTKTERPTSTPPNLVCIVTCRSETADSSVKESASETLRVISQRYESKCSLSSGGLSFSSESMAGYITGIDHGVWHIFLLGLGEDRAEPFSVEDRPGYRNQMNQFLALLPEKRFSLLTVHLGWTLGRDDAEVVLKDYLRAVGSHPECLGVVHGCLLATLRERKAFESSGVQEREMAVVSFSPTRGETGDYVWALLDDLARLALYEAELGLLVSERRAMFDQIEASERSTQLRINQIFADIRRPPDQLKPADLESLLTEVTILFSRLSVAASAMTRDNVLAESHLGDMRSLFRKWGDGGVGGYPAYSAVEMDRYERLVAPFKDFVTRVDALRVQLNTILDAVRTYLGIQQESLSIEEQKSSKDQLVRLVNLQEILHKLEILIVAVYITEMARIVFYAVDSQTADLRTALFIPVALILAMLIGRFLHRK